MNARKSAPWFAGRRALVVGMARSGTAAARLLLKYGAHVRAIDRRRRDEISSEAAELEGRGVEAHYGTMDPSTLEGRDLVVTSPGVPADLPLFREAERLGIPIAPEIELGFAVARAPTIAVTGTNGKSTTVELLGAIGRNAGRKTEVLGNIGTAVSERAEAVPEDGLLVVEVSSFQLELCTRFRPRVGVILNVTPDHLDRHGTIESYAEIKAKMFAFQTPDDFRVQPLGDPRLTRLLQPMRSRPLWFGFADPTGDGVWESGGMIRFRIAGREGTILRRDEALLPGPHNTENLCAATAAAMAVGVPERAVAKTLREFRGLPHRMALVAEIDGVRYVNDSKATNVDAVLRALESFEAPIILIAGGRDKDGDFASIAAVVRERVRRAVYVGEATAKLERAWPQVPSVRAKTLEDAVQVARSHATPGAVVLLSPGCASFDMFRNFEERGARFEAAVLEVKRSLARSKR
jgi:UDP-N-acetylmuramoylalanine--D-glutamate ligase